MASVSSFRCFLFDDDFDVVAFRFVDVDSVREKKVVIGTSPRNGMVLTQQGVSQVRGTDRRRRTARVNKPSRS